MKIAGFTCLGCLGSVVLLGIVMAVFNALVSDHPNPTPSKEPAFAVPAQPKQVARERLKIAKFDWRKDGFDTIMMADFLVQNDSDYPVKDLEIRCDHYANSGTHIDSNTRTIYDIVKAHSKKRFRNFSMGFIHSQASSSSCKITDFSLVQ